MITAKEINSFSEKFGVPARTIDRVKFVGR